MSLKKIAQAVSLAFCISLSAAPVYSAYAATPQSVIPAHARADKISAPASVLGFELGEWHARPEQLTSYYQLLASQSPRVKVRVVGYSHERRPILNVIITSEKNHQRLSEIEAARGRGESDTPLVVYLGYSVHGNEPSGANAAPAVAWHLASSMDKSVNEMLERTVVVIDPMLNPDGLARFANWANSNRGQTLVSDPNTLEHREGWPSGRGNHYWFDLNRDWLWLQHPESRAHVATFQTWRPHVFGDFHEQGTDATYFFQPGVPTRTHPLTPANNQTLTEAIAKFHAQALDARGELYFSREAFDDFYYGKGSTYPDLQGSVGILFEQASSRGHIQDSRNGLLKFDHTIANQITTSFSTIQAADAIRDQLIAHQKNFYDEAKKMAQADPNRAMLFAAENNPARLRDFSNLLKQHGIAVHQVKGSVTINGQRYDARNAIAVPLNQRQSRLLEGITELRTQFKDNTFYDVSAWSVTKAYDLASAKSAGDVIGEPVQDLPKASLKAESNIAYAFSWVNDDAAPLLAELSQTGLRLRTVTKPMRVQTTDGTKDLGIGSIVIPVAMQNTSAANVAEIIRKATANHSVEVFALSSGAGGTGVDLGSASLKTVERPRVAVLTGQGLDSTSVGELWHWIDTHLRLPATMLSTDRLAATQLERYTHIVMSDGTYRLSDEANKNIERFVKQGGVIIGVEGALNWASSQSYLQTKLVKGDAGKKSDADKAEDKKAKEGRLAYKDQDANAAKDLVAGVIFETEIDRSHPIAAGIPRDILPVFRGQADVYKLEGDRYGTVAAYTSSPVLSGYASPENAKRIAGSAAITAQRVGSGSVILASAALGFRSGWLGSRRILENALFFGKAFEKARAEGDEAHEAH
ncbi:peptidase M14 [Undibacterium seohonense]|uniref:Peptidase M14 n=1 Tax=Undibacterium seohonense TaxID=1344950 RepID=A0ABR6X125_9BURK|nr:M14 metallopeptidase family protein [Undibacterium seohonense]MBC3806486.1 peptidase M14 [Undibacterium seohonense]